jgi:quercetin dioxygenase-like cupin family protein
MAFVCSIPAVPTVQQDDKDVRITRWDFPPGAVTGWHTHGWPFAVTMLTDATLQLHDGTAVSETTLAAGQAFHSPAGVQHDVMNGSPHPIAFVEIEIKRPEAIKFLPPD